LDEFRKNCSAQDLLTTLEKSKDETEEKRLKLPKITQNVEKPNSSYEKKETVYFMCFS